MQKLLPILLKSIGAALILIGLVAAYYGPMEIHVFYFFSEGGRFHYPGFGVGSFWFAALVIQNMGYYVIAALLLPIGVGHLRLRRWALNLTHLYLWFWLGAGFLLAVNLPGLLLAAFKLELDREVLLTRLTILSVFAFITLILIPALALRFYRSEKVKAAFAAHDANIYWTERYPLPLQALILLFMIMIIVMHLAIFFQGLFPMFGQIMLGRASVYLISLWILILGILTYGIIQLQKWAWWASLAYLSLFSLSALLTFSRYSFYDLIGRLDLPAYEMEFLEQLTPLHDFHLVILIAGPLLIALGLLIYSKRYFGQSPR